MKLFFCEKWKFEKYFQRNSLTIGNFRKNPERNFHPHKISHFPRIDFPKHFHQLKALAFFSSSELFLAAQKCLHHD
jgi:hypothetical protein